jgi:phosphoinositide-3-kinase regulatory subunit 4
MIIAILMFNVSNSLGSARFLKTVKCRHRNGYMVIKIFIKSDPGLTLRNYRRRLKSQCILTLLFGRSNPIAHMIVEREALADIANIYSYQTFVETEKAGYIIRQWIASNLYDRIRYVFLMCLLSYHF